MGWEMAVAFRKEGREAAGREGSRWAKTRS